MKSVKKNSYAVGILIFTTLAIVTRGYAADAVMHNSFEPKPTYEQAIGNLVNDYDILINSEYGFKSELWGTLDFEEQGTQLYTIFINLFELDKYKNIMYCNACSAILTSVTYIRNKDGWTIKDTNAEITRIGSDGVYPAFDQSMHKTLSGKYLILSSDTKLRQGYFTEFAHLIGYLDDWKSLGLMVLSDGNVDSDECIQDNECWYWHTRSIDVLTEITNGLPDILLDRAGTIIDSDSNKVTGVGAEIYRFSGSNYQTKTEGVNNSV